MDSIQAKKDVLKLQHTLEEMEEIAEDILTSKEQLVTFDRKRQGNREALRALSDSRKVNEKSKIFVFDGDSFIRLPLSQAKSLIAKDQERVEGEMECLREDMKRKTLLLHELEGCEVNPASPFLLKSSKLNELGIS